VHAVRRQQNQDDEIGDEQRKVEGIGVIQALKRLVEEMLAQVGTDPARRREGRPCQC